MTFEILGIPQSKQSARFYATEINGKASVRSFQSSKVKREERNIRLDIKSQLPPDFKPLMEGVRVSVTFIFPFPKSFSKAKLKQHDEGKVFFKTTKPDLTDNLMKGLFDAAQGVLFLNDSQVCEVHSVKIYGHTPKTVLRIKEINK